MLGRIAEQEVMLCQVSINGLALRPFDPAQGIAFAVPLRWKIPRLTRQTQIFFLDLRKNLRPPTRHFPLDKALVITIKKSQILDCRSIYYLNGVPIKFA